MSKTLVLKWLAEREIRVPITGTDNQALNLALGRAWSDSGLTLGEGVIVDTISFDIEEG